VVFANIDFNRNVGKPGWIEATVKQLEQDVKNGARGLKVYKSLGLSNVDFKGKNHFIVYFSLENNLGPNLYFIEAFVISYEESNRAEEKILEWKNDASSFRVDNLNDYQVFGGVVNLSMTASWKEICEGVNYREIYNFLS